MANRLAPSRDANMRSKRIMRQCDALPAPLSMATQARYWPASVWWVEGETTYLPDGKEMGGVSFMKTAGKTHCVSLGKGATACSSTGQRVRPWGRRCGRSMPGIGHGMAACQQGLALHALTQSLQLYAIFKYIPNFILIKVFTWGGESQAGASNGHF